MHRFFVPPAWIGRDHVTITGPLVHQIEHVLRLGPGDPIVVLDNLGWEYELELSSLSRDEVIGRIVRHLLVTTEPRTKITFYQALLKGDKFEWVLQKGTELGVVAFVPIICDRCVVGSLNDVSANKMDRWQRLVLEAAEQSGRGKLPVVRPAILFLQACEEAGRSGGLSLIPWEEERGTGLRKLLVMEGTKELGGTQRNFRPFSVNLFIGPEGGFTHDEISKAKSYGLIPITLGPRILRSETAGLVVASAILYELGDLESRRA